MAALTMPALVANYQEKVTITKLKKLYNAMSNALILAIQENGTPDQWGDLEGLNSSAGAEILTDTFAKYLNVAKNCGTTDTSCWGYEDYLKKPDGTYYTGYVPSMPDFSRLRLNDGSVMAVGVRNVNCASVRGISTALRSECGVIYTDINGAQPPNTGGRDVFVFYLTKNAIIPAGTQDETSSSFAQNCITGTGLGCAAWVIYNENMDYLHCNNLSWDGPTKCE